MQKHRLWITGWPRTVGEGALVAKLASFGRVVGDVMITRKPSAGISGEENVFAHLTLESDTEGLAKCLRALNRSTWCSSVLRVERAKEHYTERFRREGCEAAGMAKTETEDGLACELVRADHRKTIKQMRISNPALPRAKRRRESILVHLDSGPSAAHSRYDDHGKICLPASDAAWSMAYETLMSHETKINSAGTGPQNCGSGANLESTTNQDLLDHGYVRDVCRASLSHF